MRILLVYPGHSACTYDVAAGYEWALEACGCEVRAFNYHSALAFYQKALGWWRDENPDFWPDKNAYLVLASERVIVDVIDYVPDVALIVSGFALHRRAYELLHRLDIPTVLLFTESPYQDEQQAVILSKGHVAAAFTNDKQSAGWLEDETDVRTTYLPHAYDPGLHYPANVSAFWRSDVFFHGTLWPERKELLEKLEDLPNARISGIDPHITDVDDADEVLENTLDNGDLAQHYRGTKIALNHHRTFIGVHGNGKQRHIDNGAAYSLGPRAYEIAACGTFQLCDNARPELREVFGDSVAVYRDASDLKDKINHYLRHDAEREAMAREAMKRVQNCTFEMRAKNIVIPILTEVINDST